MRLLAPLLFALSLGRARAMEVWRSDLPAALAEAREKKSLVLVDFYAPWCYSCYYMDRNVLDLPEMLRLRDRLELVKLDVDSPEGARLERERDVHGLPNYVVLNAEGSEVGRIVGEQTPGDFFGRLRTILAKNATLPDLEARARRGRGAAALAAGRAALHVHVQRRSAAQGLEFLASLPEGPRKAAAADPAARAEILRLKVFAAKQAKDPAACLEPARGLLAGAVDCASMYDLADINDCVEPLAPERRASIYALEDKPLKRLLDRNAFGKPAARCADFRSVVELATDLDEKLGRKDEAARVLSRAIDAMRAELGGRLGSDRNKADNLRVFLEMAGRGAELEALYPKLIAAYPKDYVYPYRYGKFLLSKERADEALKSLEAAAALAYGSGKLRVAEARAEALAKLGRDKEALAVADRALEEGSAPFPTEVAPLKAFRDALAKRSSR